MKAFLLSTFLFFSSPELKQEQLWYCFAAAKSKDTSLRYYLVVSANSRKEAVRTFAAAIYEDPKMKGVKIKTETDFIVFPIKESSIYRGKRDGWTTVPPK